ncbi:hypothetical protein Mal15_50450 [Stieleria maiorica]|uniref:DUF1499 domain-containing protein n=2 Tax=Stieleria maiorica TaxID=2795974 RepID=A0A5B9MIF2_9BACT|nr:hypothetical protein Mal15_50450 [Stieleria maiorica]
MIGWVTLAIAVGITPAIVAAVLLRVDDWSRDWTQNRASLDPAAERPGLRPVELDGTVQEVVDRIRRWTETDSKWAWISETSGEAQGERQQRRIKLTRTTPLMRFVDDIEVELSANPERKSVLVDATSQSRVGKGDLGQNPRNLIELTRALRGG